MGYPSMDKDQIWRTFAQYLVGDVGATTLCVLRPWWYRHGSGKNIDGQRRVVKPRFIRRVRALLPRASEGRTRLLGATFSLVIKS